MFLLNLPNNLHEQAAIERRRREEKERLARIFNVKYRTIGVGEDRARVNFGFHLSHLD